MPCGGFGDQTKNMKRIVASVGLAALGAASIQSSHAQALGTEKPWSISASLRGFYDDNVNTVKTGKINTFGVEISPTISMRLPSADQTTAELIYTYAYKWYDKKPDPSRTGTSDQTHTVAARLMHAFNERTSVSLSESFVIGQEPDQIRSGSQFASVQRISGQNVRNFGAITVNHQFTPTFAGEVGYANAFYDYEDNLKSSTSYGVSSNTVPAGTPLGIYPVGVNASRSSLLDRMEQTIHADARWTLQENTIVLVGYQYMMGRYNANEPIGVIGGVNIATNVVVTSGNRDYNAHYGYVGAEHSFRPDLFGSLRVGVRFNDNYASPGQETGTSPYVNASLRYMYAKDSNLEAGVSHDRNANDAFSTQGGSITVDSESTSAYIAVNHRIFLDLYGNAMLTFQNSTFNGGQFDGTSEQYYLANVGLEYHINQNFIASVSYHFDHLDASQTGRTYDRNRFYFGATVTY